MLQAILLTILPLFAQTEMPFQEFYGSYKIARCEASEVISTSTDFCKYEFVDIQRGPPQNGAPHTQLFFKAKKQKEIWEAISPVPPDSKYQSYSKDEQGRSHDYLRTHHDNDGTYRYRDVWINRAKKGLKLVIKIRQTPGDSDKIISNGNYEIELQ